MEKPTAMKIIWTIIAFIILAIIIIFFIIYLKKSIYRPFTMDENQCEHYYKSCVCVGLLRILETYPPRYDCKGFEICKDIDEVKCP